MFAKSLTVVLALALPTASGLQAQEIALTPIAEGFDRPLALVDAGDGSGRLFVVEQTGRIWIVAGGRILDRPFLDVAPLVSCCNERGLLGLAFHPDHEVNGWFFVYYTDGRGDTRLVRYAVSTDPNVADPASRVELLSISQPFSNHNGGQLAFGPSGMLWIGSGDGGGSGDPSNHAQRRDTLLGKLLRIDVDRGLPYAIPEDNPFRFDPAARPEIWATGLRNPWRFSFDRLTGDLFIADVGQNQWEEVSFEPVTSAGGRNYGWRRMEGSRCFEPSSGCDDGSLVHPIVEYAHDEGCSVTGGYRYRGGAVPGLFGVYVFGDFCSGTIWGATADETGAWTRRTLLETELFIASFGEDEQGELYVVDLEGSVHRVEGTTSASSPAAGPPSSRPHRPDDTRWR